MSTAGDGRVRLLFVEDTAEHQELMLLALAKARPEWAVDAFWSAESALEPARQRHYDAAILDFTLPGMTGLDFAEELRKITPDLPIVLVTARGSEKIAARALRTGLSEYLVKEGDYLEILPLAISKAIEAVAGARERERMRREIQARNEELRAINDVAASVASSLKLVEVLPDALARVVEAIQAGAGAIYVVDAEARQASLDAYQDVEEPALSMMKRWHPNRTTIRRLLDTRRSPMALSEVFRLTNPGEGPVEDFSAVEAYWALPLKVSATLIGLLCVRPSAGHAFDAARLQLLSALAQPISMAMSNARLYTQTHEQLAELTISQNRLVGAARAMVAQRLAEGLTVEINDAMTSIKGSAQMILRERGLPRPVESDAVRILEGCERVLRLSAALTSMAAAPEGRRAPHSVNRVVNNCQEQVKKTADSLGVAITTSLAPQLPTISIEGEALEQALLNIMVNAIEAMPHGGQMHIATGWEEDCLFISVADTGEGIAPENLERIFDPDFTTRLDRGRMRGLGLGLFASQNLIQTRGGTISVRSEVGKGSTFTIRLPAGAAPEMTPSADATEWSDAGSGTLVRAGGLTLNTRMRQVAVGKGRVEGLTKMESRLLEVFMTNPHIILKRDYLMREVWETEYIGDTRTLDVHVHWLRQKIEDNPSRPRLLLTVRGLGYRFGRGLGPKDAGSEEDEGDSVGH
jgi:DNA-binding response OmpR family regulator/signal transduction histidine kinase